jgi:hypothetical protein
VLTPDKDKSSHLRLGFSAVFMFVLPNVLRVKRLFEAAINLAQLPEDQNKENRNHEQQELDVHFIGPSDIKEL